MAESRILTDYFRRWFVPELSTSDVINSQHPNSTGLLSPLRTVFLLSFHIIVIGLAFTYRKRYSVVAFAVLCFYIGHLIESTVISLELQFEYRACFPVAFLILRARYLLVGKPSRGLAIAFSIVVWATLVIFTRYSANIWSNYDSMALARSSKKLDSVLAQQQAS